jgi:predicted MFS family arabinose efflux permease
MGLVYTAPSLGAIVGSAVQGIVTEQFGFNGTFFVFALIAGSSAAVFLRYMPETFQPKRLPDPRTEGMLQGSL